MKFFFLLKIQNLNKETVLEVMQNTIFFKKENLSRKCFWLHTRSLSKSSFTCFSTACFYHFIL